MSNLNEKILEIVCCYWNDEMTGQETDEAKAKKIEQLVLQEKIDLLDRCCEMNAAAFYATAAVTVV